MSRVDKPVLRCDRCQRTTEDTSEMFRFATLSHYHMSGKDEWDLCPDCWGFFRAFIENE